uniref:Iron-sulfur cluster loop n=1 Tax=Ignisphaera aggregans TaxID=334771 RepID=A0A7C2VAT0_9CREN
MPWIDIDRVRSISTVLAKFQMKPLNPFDTMFYPPPGDPPEAVLMYFLVMVAMDHRLSRPLKKYTAFIDGVELHGADLLYRLGMNMYTRNPEFFTPRKLSEIKVEEVLAWLSVGGASPPDPIIRAALLRDLGIKILKLFDGDPSRVIKDCGGYLRKPDGYGFADIMRVFKAYSDPVEKKTMLLAKFLCYRGLLKIVDRDNIRVPVDNHLTRIALRWGIVVLEKHLEDKVLQGEEVGFDDDIVIRYSVREAYRHLAAYANLDPFTLDDFLWSFGRSICLRDKPLCEKCGLRDICRAFETKMFINEHTYFNTWYY